MLEAKMRALLLAVAFSVGLATTAAKAEYTISIDEMLELEADPTAIAIRDIDADGLEDLIVTVGLSDDPENEFRVLIYLQQADGTLAQPTSQGFGGGRAIAIGDLDKDSEKEIAVEYGEGIAVLDRDVYRQRPVVRAEAHTNKSARSGYRIELIDVDRDGALDVVTKPFARDIVIYLGDGQGGVRRTVSLPINLNNYVDATSGDFNSDGYRDFAVLSSVLRAYVYLNNGTEGFAAPYTLNPNPTGGAFYPAIAAGDFNDDGRDDLIFTTDTGALSLFEQSQQGVLTYAQEFPVEWATSAMRARDLDLDGRTDLLALHSTLGLFRQGDAGLQPERSLPASGAFFQLAVGDINGDGCPDVATAASTSARVDLYKGEGCLPVADLVADLHVSPTSVIAMLQNTGSAAAAAPETTLALSVTSGTLVVGSAPGCVFDSQGPRSARMTCISSAIPVGNGSTLAIPVTIQSSDRRNVLTISAVSTTTTVEINLGNNMVRKSMRTQGL